MSGLSLLGTNVQEIDPAKDYIRLRGDSTKPSFEHEADGQV